MEKVRDIVSQGLRKRDQNQIGLKWPLNSVEVQSNFEIRGELKEIIKQELNVKSLEFSKCEELKVKLDLEMTPELEAEGYARELSRKVQAFRKKLGLNKEDEIELKIVCDKKLINILENQKKFLIERTNSKNLKFSENADNSVGEREEFKIKDKSGLIFINFN
jgi:isoleucyl-tRNA synthetase